MTKRNRQQVQDRRNAKKVETGRVVREKFEEGRKVLKLTAKNESQRKALSAFETKKLVILSGSAGTGKSELMCWWASKLWCEGKINSIVIVRPHQQLGNDYGAVSGNDTLKLLPFCMSMLMKLKKYLGYGILKNNFRMDVVEGLFNEAAGIQILPIEKCQGMSFGPDTLILADELQNATVAQVKALTTRSEEGCVIIGTGDNLQSALKGKNGLQYLEEALQKHPHQDAEVIKFTPKDNCRSGIAGHLAALFETEGSWEDK